MLLNFGALIFAVVTILLVSGIAGSVVLLGNYLDSRSEAIAERKQQLARQFDWPTRLFHGLARFIDRLLGLKENGTP